MMLPRTLLTLATLLPLSPLWAASNVSLQSATVARHPITQELVVDAVIEAINKSTVSSQTAGRIVEVNVDVDDPVQQGAVIIRFRDIEQRSQLDAAQARLFEAEANFTRVKDLFERQLVSQADFDKANASLKAARATQEQAQEQLEHTVVRAPFSGIVVSRHIEVGEIANPGEPLMTGISLDQLRAVASVPQMQIAAVRSHSNARIILPYQGDRTLTTSRLTFSPYADAATHTFKVRVDLPKGSHGIYPGTYTKVAFKIGRDERLLIPTTTVVHRGEVTGVYVLRDDTISFRQIRSGSHYPNGLIEILAGLDAGEQIALDPIQAGISLKQLRNGEK